MAQLQVKEQLLHMIGVVEDKLCNVGGHFLLGHEATWKRSSCLKVKNVRHALNDAPFVLLVVVVPAQEILGALSLLAGQSLVDQRVVNLLFPAVTSGAERLQGTPLVVVPDKGASLPILAQIAGVVVKKMWLSAEVLPVVRVDTLRLVMLIVLKGTPLGLEVVHVEVLVASVVVDQSRLYIEL